MELNERETIILRMRQSGQTLSAVGKHVGLSAERVRQIAAKALRKLGGPDLRPGKARQ